MYKEISKFDDYNQTTSVGVPVKVESHDLRYVNIIQLLFLIEHLYLIGV